jgi:predicted metal-dependent TIM-barrel fold hydrolase
MNKTDDKPIILTKRKNIQTVIDYCLEQKISFNASPRAISIDEWEIELNITSIKGAIALGIFVRENKLELYGMGELVKPKASVTATSTAKKSENKENVTPITPSLIDELELDPTPVVAAEENNAPTLSFDLNNSNN